MGSQRICMPWKCYLWSSTKVKINEIVKENNNLLQSQKSNPGRIRLLWTSELAEQSTLTHSSSTKQNIDNNKTHMWSICVTLLALSGFWLPKNNQFIRVICMWSRLHWCVAASCAQLIKKPTFLLLFRGIQSFYVIILKWHCWKLVQEKLLIFIFYILGFQMLGVAILFLRVAVVVALPLILYKKKI